MNDNNFKSAEELIYNLQRGGEVEFEYDAKEYSITHIPDGIVISQAYNDDTEKVYETVEDVLGYEINGKKLGDIIHKLDVTFRCFD